MSDEAKTPAVEGPTKTILPKFNDKKQIENVGELAKEGQLFHKELAPLKEAVATAEAAAKANANETTAKALTEAKEALGKKSKELFGSEALTFTSRTKAKVSANWGQSKGWGKAVRVVGTSAGALLVLKGLKDIIAPGTNEEGVANERSIPTIAVETLGGAALVYASLIHGGANKSMGVHI